MISTTPRDRTLRSVLNAQRFAAFTIAALLGVFLIFGVGFASPEMIHNAAHDLRHTFALPCH